MNNCASTLEMLYLSNEDNYLKGKYTLALKSFKGDDEAFEYAYNELKSTNITESNQRINFVLGYYISALNNKEEFEHITDEVKSDIYNYFNSLYGVYKNEIGELKVTDNYYLVKKFNLLKLNYRITDIYYAMNTIDVAIGMNEDMENAKSIVESLSKDFPSLL